MGFDDGSEGEDGLSSWNAPSHSAAAHSLFHNVFARPLDRTAANRPTVGSAEFREQNAERFSFFLSVLSTLRFLRAFSEKIMV